MTGVIGSHPQTPETLEETYLAALIVDSTLLARYPANGAPLSPKSRALYSALERAAAKSEGRADWILLKAEMEAAGIWEGRESVDYLERITLGMPMSANAGWYLRLFLDAVRAREAVALSTILQEAVAGGDDPPRIAEHMDALRDKLNEGRSDDAPKMSPLDWRAILAHEGEPEIPWAVRELLAHGDNVIIGGEPGAGKSWLAADLALALATGGPWLDWEAAEPQRVLYIDEENPRHVTVERLAALAHGRGITEPPDIVYLSRESLSAGDSGIDRLRRIIEHVKPRWVVFDSLIRFHSASENDNSEMARTLGRMASACRDYGAGLIVLHHLSKPSKDKGTDLGARLRGAGDILAWSDAYIALEGDRTTERRTLTIYRSRSARGATGKPRSIMLAEVGRTATIQCVGTEPQAAEATTIDAILAVGEDGITRKALIVIATDAGYQDPEKAVTRALGKLKGQGTVRTSREGKEVRFWHREHAPIGAK